MHREDGLQDKEMVRQTSGNSWYSLLPRSAVTAAFGPSCRTRPESRHALRRRRIVRGFGTQRDETTPVKRDGDHVRRIDLPGHLAVALMCHSSSLPALVLNENTTSPTYASAFF